jgi:hypothetical protein
VRTILALLLLAPGALLASVQSDLRAELERRVAMELDAARRTAAAEEHYRRGKELSRTGNEREAAEEFGRAEAIILDAGEDAYFETSLRAYLHELRGRVEPRPHGPAPGDGTSLAGTPDLPVDSVALAWLRAAVARPVPQERELRAVFRGRRVPEDLIYVGLVESGYDARAVSRAGAAGAWQFMPDTARRYGLRMDRRVDERHDLVKAAGAAAEYLRDLFELLGDWTLAIAAYNAGEYRVLRAVQGAGTHEFSKLARLLPAETVRYVPRVLAAIRLARGGAREETP